MKTTPTTHTPGPSEKKFTALFGKINPNLAADMAKAGAKAKAAYTLPSPAGQMIALRNGMANEQIRQDMLAVNFQIQETDAELIEWTRAQLVRFGLTGAAADVYRWTLAAYGRWVAREILTDGTAHDLPFSVFLEGDAALDYWRAIAIAATKGQDHAPR